MKRSRRFCVESSSLAELRYRGVVLLESRVGETETEISAGISRMLADELFVEEDSLIIFSQG